MTTIDDIIMIAEQDGVSLVPLIDNNALNVELDKLDKTGREGYFIMLPTSLEDASGKYDDTLTTRIEIVATSQTTLTASDVEDFHNVDKAAASLIAQIRQLITAISDTGRYDAVSRISYKVIPYRYDSLMTAVTATFNLTEFMPLC